MRALKKQFKTSSYTLSLGMLLLCLSVFMMSCTREPSKTTEVNLSVPAVKSKVGALGGIEVLSYVAVNISGSGISPTIFKNWDAHRYGSNMTALPTSYSFTGVNKGSNRLFQVLLVYENSESEAMSFYYGDAVKNLEADQESVGIV